MSTLFKPLFLGVFALTLAACATTAPRAPGADTAAVADSAAVPKAKAVPPDCITATGTRIKRAPNDCTATPGRVFTQDDLDRTGAVSVSEALERLDPRFTR